MPRLFPLAATLFVLGIMGSCAAFAATTKAPKRESGNTHLRTSFLEDSLPPANTVVLQGLNKVTGHASRLAGPLGTVMRFGTLEIIARRCWRANPEDRPENAALLDIRELKAGEGPDQIFLGWMFSSSPALSSLEHPVYDVSVLACETRENPEKE